MALSTVHPNRIFHSQRSCRYITEHALANAYKRFSRYTDMNFEHMLAASSLRLQHRTLNQSVNLWGIYGRLIC